MPRFTAASWEMLEGWAERQPHSPLEDADLLRPASTAVLQTLFTNKAQPLQPTVISMHIQYPRIPSTERLQNCLYQGWWHHLAGCQTKSFRSEASFEFLFPEPMSVWLMAEVCILPPNEQRVWFVNLHVITGVKDMNGTLMMIPDMDHLLQDRRQCQRGALPGERPAHPMAGNLCLVLMLAPSVAGGKALNFSATRAMRSTAFQTGSKHPDTSCRNLGKTFCQHSQAQDLQH